MTDRYELDQADALERVLRARRQPGLFPAELAEEFVLPHYGGHSLANVPATIAALLGVTLPGALPPLAPAYLGDLGDGVQRVVLVLLDALGYLALRSVLRSERLWARVLRRGRLLPMTSVAPSTTTTALLTLATAAAPAHHGMLGYELWLREFGVLAEMIGMVPVFGAGRETLLDWGLSPEAFVPSPSVGALLGEGGVHTVAYLPAQHLRSALSRMIYRGYQEMVGYYSLDDMWAQLRRMLTRETAERALHMIYWPGIDSTVHRRGTGGGHWQAEARNALQPCVERLVRGLPPRQRQGTLLVLLADHGFVDTPVEAAVDTEANPVLWQHLAVPHSGEARFAYLHLFDGASPSAQQAVQEALGPHVVVVPTEDALAAGLFGATTPSAEARSRLGHLLVIARGAHYLDRQEKRLRLRGRHGGLSPDEMLIPWLALRLDDLAL